MASYGRRTLVRAVVLGVISIAFYFYDRQHPGALSGSGKGGHKTSFPLPPASSSHDDVETGKGENGPHSQEGRYEKYEGCTLVEHRQNDGDSFFVKLPGGRVEQFRLYYVDCPESAFRTYGGGATNRERIDDQAQYFHITPEQAVDIGQKAKHYTHDLLSSRPFTIYTHWEDPFGDHRYHAVVAAPDGRWLHQELVKEGMVRIFTKPAEMPDGTPASEEVRHLREMEAQAKSDRKGAWGVGR